MSRASSASEGEAAPHHKANTANQHSENAINASSRVFGLDGASDNYGSAPYPRIALLESKLTRLGYNHRALSRSPSPYRRKRTRSPSPYRRSRAADRSPSPYRRSRANHNREGSDSRPYHKRKASPPRGTRPDKRHYTDRNRHSDHRYKSFADDTRAPNGFVKERHNGTDRSFAKPISYAELEKPNAVPDFRAGLPTSNGSSKPSDIDEGRNKPHQPTTNSSRTQEAQPSVREDVEM